jgi:hypothetical protein
MEFDCLGMDSIYGISDNLARGKRGAYPSIDAQPQLYLLRILLLTVGLLRRADEESISRPAAKRVCWAAGHPLDGTRRRLRSTSRTKNSVQAVVRRVWGEYPAFR